MNLPFDHLNLRFNPFGELTSDQRKQVAFVDIESLTKSLNKEATAIQFLADHGRGKTTHLLSLHDYYSKTEYIKIYQGDKPDFTEQFIRFVDSVENLTKKSRLELYKKTSSIAFTSHADLSKELHKAGFSVTTIKVCMENELTLRDIFTQRIKFAQRNDGAIPVVDQFAIKKLKTLYGDDIRSMEGHLYELFQQMERIENVKV
ncbi:MAG: hypothetical protein DIZ80_07770 [endosymbiont of Galathealinum brachiosum]|uniref:Chromosomal replication initiator protein DnaA domain-containing protein n=1 Tax=endosymbiont of Galathealinum brachiosum TaxID=2200906 RepID=A0A370DGQ9_9GAMM|nr:MAG: hypothetical protein DIZ80_07770 [endosymbiont of Galathealinum brachiosum]